MCSTEKSTSSASVESANIVSRGTHPSTINEPQASTSGLSLNAGKLVKMSIFI
jgi:hypothetical protein